MAKNTIKLKKYLDVNVEYPANAAITPGNLIELLSTGKVRKHTAEGGLTLPMFALEDELQGRDIDTNYAEDAPVQCWIAQRGEEVYALIADGEDVSVADKLASNGDGTLKVVESDDVPIAIALEAIDLSGSSGTYPATGFRIKVRIL